MGGFAKDLKQAARGFAKTPGFTVTAIGAIALGIAANTAIFSVVNTVLLKPFAYPDSGRIVMFQNRYRSGVRSGSAAAAEYNWWRQHTESIKDISAYSFSVVSLTGTSSPEQLAAMHVSANFFRLCGANAAYGRTFTAEEDFPHAPKTAVLAYALWQRRFEGAPQVIGRRLTLDGESYEIVGVLGRESRSGAISEQSLLSGDVEIDQPPDLYLPYQIDPNSTDGGHGFNVAGRLKTGVTLAAADAEVQANYREYARRRTDLTPGAGFGVQALQEAITGGVRKPLLILLGAVGLVLLIACANVANLLLARGAGRRREMAIRAAVGAARGQIVRQLLTESLLLAFAGCGLGLLAGAAGIRVLLRLSPALPRIGMAGANVALDWRVFGFTFALTIVTGVLFGLLPALESSRIDLSSALKESGRTGTTGLRTRKTRSVLVTLEVALAVVLVIGAGLLIRTFLVLRQVNPGFETNHVLTMRVSMADPRFAEQASEAVVIRDALQRIRTLPGVESAAAACCVPLDSRLQVGFQIAGRSNGPGSQGVTGWSEISADYLETFRIPIVRGRTFTGRDENGPPVMIINQALARQFWGDGDPLDSQITIGGRPPARIVGVAGDVRDLGLNREPRPTVYVPSVSPGGLLKLIPWAFAIRTRDESAALRNSIARKLTEATGGLPVGQIRTMDEVVARSRAAGDFNTLVMTFFGCAALLLAAVGIYGLIAYSVAQRRAEIGIRLALGAEARDIRGLVVRQGLQPALAGVAVGLGAAFWLSRWLSSLLFGVKASDPMVFSTVPILLLLVALAAVWIPARRASRVDPLEALRYE